MRAQATRGWTFGFVAAALWLAVTIAEAQHEGHGAHAEPTARGEPADHSMRGMLGAYSMTRESSGTSWQPEATPMMGRHFTSGEWMGMTHGFAVAAHADAEGPRGDEDAFIESMLMAMAQRPLAGGTLALRGMASLDPWLVGDDGYPLLLQTGETADGRTPLVDRQHPHDLLMELAASYSRAWSDRSSFFVYAGLPGEPALGPPTFMHRFSGIDNPEAPLSHHWLDSTHITFGVVTTGLVVDGWKIEASAFNGREPDEKRYDIETRGLSSWSARLSWNPAPSWALQVSHGEIESPEQLEPGEDVARTTASVIHHGVVDGIQWQTTLSAGRNDPSEGPTTDAALAETALVLRERDTLYARGEHTEKDELLEEPDPLAGRVFEVRKLTIGGVHDFVAGAYGRAGVGAQYSLHGLPGPLESRYGERPGAWLVFLRWRQ